MKLVQLSALEFVDYAKASPMSSFYHTKEYALFMEDNNYDYDFLGIKDSFGNILGATLIAIKKIDNKYSYGYAPNGFIIDYKDRLLVKDFANAINSYYKKKHLLFIKINPNIIVSNYNKEEHKFILNNQTISKELIKNGFQELKDNKYFEAMIPKYHPEVDLKNFTYKSLEKNVRNKIRKSYRKGLSIEKVDISKLEDIYPLIKNKTKKSLDYYKSLYHAFDSSKMIDVFRVKINFEEYLINSKSKYEQLLKTNIELNNIVRYNHNEKAIRRKMQSDIELNDIKNDVIKATNGLKDNKIKTIGCAITIKYKNKVYIYVSGYDKTYKDSNPNDFLYYKLIEYYKYNYDYIDLNGFSGDLSDDNPYSGLNNFKLGFNPEIYETIGEYDIIFHKLAYNKYAGNGTLSKIFKNAG